MELHGLFLTCYCVSKYFVLTIAKCRKIMVGFSIKRLRACSPKKTARILFLSRPCENTKCYGVRKNSYLPSISVTAQTAIRVPSNDLR